MFGNGEMKLLFVSSLAAEQWTENDCKEVSYVWTFHFLLRKAPWESRDLMHEGLCNHVTSYGTVCWWMNAICGGAEDVRDAACSGAPAAMTDEICGVCWCCAWGRQQHNMNSNCSRHGNIHSRHVLHSAETGREEEGLCKVDSIHTKWRPASHMCNVG